MQDQLLRQAEENYRLKNRLDDLRVNFKGLIDSQANAKEIILKELLGENFVAEDLKKYSNVPFHELFRVLKQKYENVDGFKLNLKENEGDNLQKKAERYQSKAPKDVSKIQRIKRLEERLEKQLRIDSQLTAQLDGFRNKNSILIKSNSSKEETITKLTNHIEKLVKRLKHETALKLNAIQTEKTLENKIIGMEFRVKKANNKAKQASDTLKQMKRAETTLQDQLNLMDRKYIELRTSLDFIRSNSNREIKKLNDIIMHLKMKIIGG